MKVKFDIEIKPDIEFKVVKFTKEEAKNMGLLKKNLKDGKKVETNARGLIKESE